MKKKQISEEIIQQIISDVHKEVIGTWSTEGQTSFFLGPYTGEDDLISYHHSFGRHIRNKYRLWQYGWEPELKDGVDYSENHPDQISMRIIREVWKRGPK